MITLEDCIALCGLTEDEVLAIAEHEHIPEMAAVELAAYLLMSEQGRTAHLSDDRRRHPAGAGARAARGSDTLLHVLHHFLRQHPEACPRRYPWSRVM